jgi:hypothetical protein
MFLGSPGDPKLKAIRELPGFHQSWYRQVGPGASVVEIGMSIPMVPLACLRNPIWV